MKKVIAVQHVDGTRQAVCPKCGAHFDWTSTSEGDEYGCPNCGMTAEPQKTEYDSLEDELLFDWPSDWPVFDGRKDPHPRCPQCGGFGKCIVNEMMIDVPVRIMSCTICDSFWRIEG